MTQLDSPEVRPSARTLNGSLGVTAIVFMVVAAASPLTAIGGSAPLGMLLGNGIGFPALFVVSAVVLLLFSVGLAAMTKHVPKPGAFFTYVGYGLGRSTGLVAAWMAMLTYTAVQAAVYGYLGSILSVTVLSLGGPAITWWAYSLVCIALVGVLGYRHIDLSSKVLGILLIAEVGLVLALVAAVVLTGGESGLSAAPFEPASVVSGAPGVGLMLAMASFIGFEATAIFRDEAKDPDRTIPRATYAAVLGIGAFYALASWALVMAWGPDDVLGVVAEDPGTFIITTMSRYLGTVGEVGVNVLLVTAMFACVLSFHNVIARYQHSMANAGAMPEKIAAVHPTHLSPHVSSLTQTVTAGVLIIAFAVLQLDPLLQVFTWFAGVATLAVAVLMALTSVAIIVYLARTKKDRRPWNSVVAPALGLLGLAGSAALIAAYFPVMVGDVDANGAPAFGAVSWLLLALTLVFPLIGYAQAAWIKARRPLAYVKLTDTIAS
ncbi:MAG: APC family permease [Microbacterium sp.]|uniref:APC family permease n=1 Tax=Microbacterium sp. TaxID=51671 RepID=UPI003BB037BC